MKTCIQCGVDISHKSRKALYCGTKCKCKYLRSNDPTGKRAEYRERYLRETGGKAVQLYHGAKSRSKKERLEFELTPEWIQQKLDTGICEVTGLPLVLSFGEGKKPWSPSLDRIDSSKGYTKDNTRMTVWLYNAAKNVFQDSDVLLMATALVNKDGSMKSQRSKKGK